MVQGNWLAVAVAAVGHQALGALWNASLFGSTRMDASGYEAHEGI